MHPPAETPHDKHVIPRGQTGDLICGQRCNPWVPHFLDNSLPRLHINYTNQVGI
jgi:hypothetical protein